MNKRKILALAMALSMVAILAVGATLAYFTDTDHATNTMVIGNVEIEQREHERVQATDGSFTSTLQAFSQNKTVMPAPAPSDYESLAIGGQVEFPAGMKVGMLNNPNCLDKIVSVKNTGDNKVYVRTFLAMPYAFKNGINMITTTGKDGAGDPIWAATIDFKAGETVTIDGVKYDLGVYTYAYEGGVLETGEVTYPNLVQYYLNGTTTQADVEAANLTNNEINVLVFSQAVQADGFKTADEAFNAAFGKCDTTNAEKWFNEIF